MNSFIELNPHEAESVSGGLDTITLGIFVAIGGFVVSNWTTIKQGFAQGAADGYLNAT